MRKKARIGYISASNLDELGYDFGHLIPEGVEMVGASPSQPIRLVTLEAIEAAEAGLDLVAQELARREVDAIVISIAPLVYVKGKGYDKQLIARIERLTGLPTTTNQTAGIDALRSLGVGRVILLNPNTSDLLEKQVEFFRQSGVQVVAARSMDIPDNRDIDRVEEATSYQFIKEAVTQAPPAHGLYLSGPCWRTLDLIEPIEQEIGLSVVTALQAMVWASLRMVGVSEPISGYGRLMRSSGTEAVEKRP
ncbi:MAG: hypothetical protein ACE5IZ_00420 [Dehalococcoidia bacterium]